MEETKKVPWETLVYADAILRVTTGMGIVESKKYSEALWEHYKSKQIN